MPRVDPYKHHYDFDYEYEPSTAGAMLFVSVIAAIIVASLLWANFSPRFASTNSPVANMQPMDPKTPGPILR
ncbi:MAG TPA: hypothetical protein VKT73_06765 [Xanthobacteraceae bacterium]|nr:hypothetical protein [Xanthobacteraceae bacterium]